jgi:hypothetical protein
VSEGKLDPRLRFVQEQSVDERAEFLEALRLGPAEAATAVASVEVLLRCRKAPGTKMPRTVEKKLAELGVSVLSSVDGPAIVVSGLVPLDQLDEQRSRARCERTGPRGPWVVCPGARAGRCLLPSTPVGVEPRAGRGGGFPAGAGLTNRAKGAFS